MMSSGDCTPGGAEDCITMTRSGLSSFAALVVDRLDVVPLPPRSPRRRWRVVGWADILLDAIGGVESALREEYPRTMTGVSQYWFSGHFRQVFSTPMHYPAYIISDRPSKQPLMVCTFLKVYMELGSYFLFLQEQIKDIIIFTQYPFPPHSPVCSGQSAQASARSMS